MYIINYWLLSVWWITTLGIISLCDIKYQRVSFSDAISYFYCGGQLHSSSPSSNSDWLVCVSYWYTYVFMLHLRIRQLPHKHVFLYSLCLKYPDDSMLNIAKVLCIRKDTRFTQSSLSVEKHETHSISALDFLRGGGSSPFVVIQI